MGRPRTGGARQHGDHWDIRITLPDGTRSPRMCQAPGMSEAKAREKAARLTALAAAEALPKAPAVASPELETLEAWSLRWCEDRESRGLTSVRADRARLRKWVWPRLGATPMAKVSKADVEALVEWLDVGVREGALAWKSATNVFGLISKMFDDAAHAKTRALRVRSDDPAHEVRGPDRGTKKAKAYLYPSEFDALMRCGAVPVQWRRLYAIATMLYSRAAEVRGLEWGDVDLAHGVVLVHRTVDDAGKTESTKGDESRRIPIEPALRPVLEQMREDAGGVGRVVPYMPVEKHLAPMLRRDLKRAGVGRVELFANDRTRKRMRFHDLRSTGITWMAVRGDDPLKIKRRAGHRTFSTTEGYIREAEALREGFGDVFADLPEALLVSGKVSGERIGANGHAYVKIGRSRIGAEGFEPAGKSKGAPVSGQKAPPSPPVTPGSARANHADSHARPKPVPVSGSLLEALAAARMLALAESRYDVAAALLELEEHVERTPSGVVAVGQAGPTTKRAGGERA